MQMDSFNDGSVFLFFPSSFHSCPKYLLLAYKLDYFDKKCAIVMVSFMLQKKFHKSLYLQTSLQKLQKGIS